MRKTLRFFLPLLLLCTLLFSVTALPAFAARIELGDASENAQELTDTVTGVVTRLEYDYLLGYTGMTTYDGNLMITLPFVAELIVDILFGLIAVWTLIYILWSVKVFPNGTGFDRVMAPCEKYFYGPLVANVKNAVTALCKNANKLQAGFYWAVLGLGAVHNIGRLTLNLLFGEFSLAGQILLPFAMLFCIFLVMGNGSFLNFRIGNFLPVAFSVAATTYLGFTLYASFTSTAELTLTAWISRVATMALALFFIGVIVNQWVPQMIGSTLLQAGGVLYLVFAGAMLFVRAYTVPGAIFTDLFLLCIPVLFYFTYESVRCCTPATAEAAEDTAEPADEAVEEVAEETVDETEEEVTEEVALEDETAEEEVVDNSITEE